MEEAFWDNMRQTIPNNLHDGLLESELNVNSVVQGSETTIISPGVDFIFVMAAFHSMSRSAR